VNRGEALTYAKDGSDWKLWKDGFETHPSLGFQLISTPGDMAKFIQSVFDLKLISQASLNQMKTMSDDEGLGLVTFTFAGKTFYRNTGGGDNYGSWLMDQPEEKLVVAYATNAKVHPVKDIISGVIDIYYGKPFQIPPFDTIAVSPEVLDKYVGVYSNPDAPRKWTTTRDGGTLFVQPGSEGAAALEATAQDKFQLLGGRIVFEFDAAKNQMILKRGGHSMVFTKENDRHTWPVATILHELLSERLLPFEFASLGIPARRQSHCPRSHPRNRE
jgi:D-alanyl-D-alanine carboxypeptidase